MSQSVFPKPGKSYELGYIEGTAGLSKRELFAAMALQGILAHPKSSATPEFLATVAVETADALLAALAEGEKK